MADDPFVSSPQQQQEHQQQQPPPHIYRPIPRRTFAPSSHTQDQSQSQSQSHNSQAQHQQQAHSDEAHELWTQNTPPTLLDSRNRSSDFLAQLNARLLRTSYNARNNPGYDNNSASDTGAPSRNKSYLNMTGSTLYGIYDDVGSALNTTGERSVADTPWGTGAETPARHYSIDSNYSQGNPWENGGMGSPDGGLTMRTKERTRRGTGPGAADVRDDHRRQPSKPHRTAAGRFAVTAGKLAALFAFGVTYGVIVSHLHDTRELAVVNVGGVDRGSWIYIASWGAFGITLGSLLPYLDLIWNTTGSANPAHDSASSSSSSSSSTETEKESESSLGEQLNEVVRSIGAFVGIAFAIRRLPWQSTLQLTLTLALVNPALWYILDRSKLGFSFSLITTSILTSFIFLSNPDVLPSPALPATMNNGSTTSFASLRGSTGGGGGGGAQRLRQGQGRGQEADMFAGLVSYDNLATVTWVGSVIFCSCVCFGGIGRRLAVLDGWEREGKRKR